MPVSYRRYQLVLKEKLLIKNCSPSKRRNQRKILIKLIISIFVSIFQKIVAIFDKIYKNLLFHIDRYLVCILIRSIASAWTHSIIIIRTKREFKRGGRLLGVAHKRGEKKRFIIIITSKVDEI